MPPLLLLALVGGGLFIASSAMGGSRGTFVDKNGVTWHIWEPGLMSHSSRWSATDRSGGYGTAAWTVHGSSYDQVILAATFYAQEHKRVK